LRSGLPDIWFFDLDGTLTDPFVGITSCIRFALSELAADVPAAADLGWCIGPPLRDSFVQLLDEQRADRAVELYRQRFADVGLFENKKYPAVDQLLTAINAMNAVCYVASSKPLVFVERILERFELSRYFIRSFGSELSGLRSDKTELLAYALEQTGAEANRCVMVGDRKHDAIGARNNDIRSWGAGWGFGSRAELEAAGAEIVFSDCAELLGFVSE